MNDIRGIKVEKSCEECPYAIIHGTAIFETALDWCALEKASKIEDIKVIAPFCPLPPWPSLSKADIEDWARKSGRIDTLMEKLKSIGVIIKERNE